MPGTPEATIVRGPMASEHYTAVHNAIARGQIIPARYVGVWTAITSHTAGWRLTETALADSLGASRNYIRAAISAMEAAHLIVRRRRRLRSGQLGGAVWIVTDLAVQLRALGVDDPATIASRVAAEAERLVCGVPQGRRHVPEGTQVATSENAADAADIRRSEPMYPQGRHKKTISRRPKTNHLASRREGAQSVGWSDAQDALTHPEPALVAVPVARADSEPLEPAGPGAEYLQAVRLPGDVPLSHGLIRQEAPHVARLLESGWTAAELSDALTGGFGGVRNPQAVVRARLRGLRPKSAAASPADAASARVDALVRLGTEGAHQADRILGTRGWQEPPRAGHSTRDYLLSVLPRAAEAFIEARRDALIHVLTTNPLWRAA